MTQGEERLDAGHTRPGDDDPEPIVSGDCWCVSGIGVHDLDSSATQGTSRELETGPPVGSSPPRSHARERRELCDQEGGFLLAMFPAYLVLIELGERRTFGVRPPTERLQVSICP